MIRKRFEKAENRIVLLFVLAALLEGLLFAFLLPPGQTPDETTHYRLMEAEFGTEDYTDQLVSGLFGPGGFNEMQTRPEVKVNRQKLDALRQVRFVGGRSLSLHPGLSAVRHLPAGIGFYMGVLLNLPMLACTHLAEICSVLFFVGMGWLILNTVPFKKDLFAFCLLLPITLQQCSSVNYDAVLIPCAFLLFAYVLKLYEGQAPIRWKQVSVLALLAGLLVLIKPPYVLMALTALIIPADRFELRIGKTFEAAAWIHRFRVLWIILLGLGGAAGLYVFIESPVVKTILSDLLELPAFLGLVLRTFLKDGGNYALQTIGVFGWLDSRVSLLFAGFCVLVAVLLMARRREAVRRALGTGRRIWLLAVMAGVGLGIIMALQEYTYGMLNWDRSVGIDGYRAYIRMTDSIQGIQGRYLIPCLPVVMTALSGRKPSRYPGVYALVQGLYYLTAVIHATMVLMARYW